MFKSRVQDLRAGLLLLQLGLNFTLNCLAPASAFERATS